MSKIIFKNKWGESHHGESLKVINSSSFQRKYRGKINLIFTSPPFSLIKKKKYGNEYGNNYIEWFKEFAKPLVNLLTEDGSIVIEMGNSWEKGDPVFSTVPIEALLEFKKEANLHLCQEFICHNPGRIPSPAEWVTIRRIRVKDSYTKIWWMSKTPYPKANNKNILAEYSTSMRKKFKNNEMNTGLRPSGHKVTVGFKKNNGGSISPNFLDFEGQDFLFDGGENSLSIANTNNQLLYNSFCKQNELPGHPARMQIQLTEYFIRFLTEKNDIIYDPFSGSNTSGMVAQELKRRWVTSEKNINYIKGSLIRFYSENKSKNIIERMAEKSL